MREVLVVARCDRCKQSIENDEPAQTWTIMGFDYRIDLCATCQEDVAQFLNFLPPPENFRCPDCDRVFDTQQGLSMHRTRTHSKTFGQPKPPTVDPGSGLLCAECGQEFANRYALSGHMGKHQREKR